MFNQNIFMYLVFASTIGTVASTFPFDSIDAQSGEPGEERDILVITLENWGGVFPDHADRIYNSHSETLTIADGDVRQTFISKHDDRIENLKNIIANTSFFDTHPQQGSPSACCDLIHNTMSISMGLINGTLKSNTVYWHEASEPIVADELNKIASQVKSLH